LQETLERHRTTANDLQNVLYSTDVATLFLDLDLNIRFFTPAARAIFRVIPPMSAARWPTWRPCRATTTWRRTPARCSRPRTRASARSRAPTGKWFLRRIQPYRAEGGRVEGVVITYVDITERKRTNAALVAAMDEAETRDPGQVALSGRRQPRPAPAPAIDGAAAHAAGPAQAIDRGGAAGALLDQTLIR
jgi:two-component system, chemotaxis family, CheB/CheR fusion protein